MGMFMIKRNQVVVTALAVMIAAAGYLNFQESRGSTGNQTALQLTEEGDVTALVDYSALPDDVDTAESDPATAETAGDGAAVFVSANAGSSDAFFAGGFRFSPLKRSLAGLCSCRKGLPGIR